MIRHTAVFIVSCVLWSCNGTPKTELQDGENAKAILGEAQGTTYSVKYLATSELDIKKSQIDSVFTVIDQSLSVWVPSSTISLFNSSDSIVVNDPHFINVFFRGKEISELTSGTFHPMIMPLVRAWGFGPEGGTLNKKLDLDSLKALVDFNMQIVLINDTIGEEPASLLFLKKPGQQIDVNSYAQGYAVDVVAEFLEKQGIENYMVELGGELRASGLNEKGELWRIGVDKPVADDNQRELKAVMSLKDASLATSGTYRKFYELDGKKYSHTINPITAMPVDHNLLSVTVLAGNCTNADAFATAFMVMGVEQTKEFLNSHPDLGLEIYMIFDDGFGGLESYSSDGMLNSLDEL
jgi:thiamine biosynthesis lipoprotein